MLSIGIPRQNVCRVANVCTSDRGEQRSAWQAPEVGPGLSALMFECFSVYLNSGENDVYYHIPLVFVQNCRWISWK